MRAAQQPPVQDPSRGPLGGVRFHRGTVQLSPPPLGARLSIADQLRKESSSRDWFPQANTVYRNGVGPIVVGVSFIQEIGENGMAKNEVIERFAIQDLLARYAHAIDDLNPEEWARCFTPDGVFQLGSQALRGHAALRAYGEVHVREIRCRHMTGNFLYKIDGNKATGQASVLATLATPGGYKFFAQGRYVDQLVKQRGQWLIAHRRVDLDPLASDPEKIVGLSDPDVAPLFQPLIDAWARLGEKV
jgi:3-phenylpropionate/cinnamic acid dioxygenase small subunit